MNRRKAHYKGFSLIEALVALVTAVMTLAVVFAIYDRARRASDSITQKLDSSSLQAEILQRIAEDIDRIAGPGADAAITIANSFQSGLPAAQLTISSRISDKDGRQQVLEKVVWQTDYDRPTGRLILYRSHSGLIWEDTLLDREQRADWTPDRQLFVPLCTGISYFKVEVPQPQNFISQWNDPNRQTAAARQNRYDQKVEEQKFLDIWNQPQLPPAILITISFAAPIEGRVVGGAEVPDDQKIKRTIMIDRSKKMNFVYVPLAQRDANLPRDANSAMAARRTSDSGNNDQMRLYNGDGSAAAGGGQPSDDGRRRNRRLRDRGIRQ
jgi:Tfp pilus assembly protein PilV